MTIWHSFEVSSVFPGSISFLVYETDFNLSRWRIIRKKNNLSWNFTDMSFSFYTLKNIHVYYEGTTLRIKIKWIFSCSCVDRIYCFLRQTAKRKFNFSQQEKSFLTSSKDLSWELLKINAKLIEQGKTEVNQIDFFLWANQNYNIFFRFSGSAHHIHQKILCNLSYRLSNGLMYFFFISLVLYAIEKQNVCLRQCKYFSKIIMECDVVRYRELELYFVELMGVIKFHVEHDVERFHIIAISKTIFSLV